MLEWLAARRQELKMTQSVIASKAGISRAYYTQIELSRRIPSIRIAKKLAKILEIDWRLFYDE